MMPRCNRNRLLVSAVLCTWVAVAAAAPYFPVIESRGGPYASGQQVGQAVRPRVLNYLANDSAAASLVAFCAGPHGAVCESLLRASQAAVPHLVDELRGFANGTGLPFSTVWALNVADEVHSFNGSFPHMAAAGKLPSACSTLLNSSSGQLGHNEDGGWCLSPIPDLYSVWAHGDGTAAAYRGLAYPGTLIGYAYAANAHGFGMSLNSLFPTVVDVHGVPNTLLARSIMNATSIDDAVRVLHRLPVASGCAINMGSVADRSHLATVELSVPSGVVVHHVHGGAIAAHFNQYVLAPVPPQVPDASSEHRRQRVDALLRSHAGLLAVLGDRRDPAYPIWRDAQPPDDCQTVVTARFDFTDHRNVQLFEMQDPDSPGASADAVVVPFSTL